MPVIVEKEIEKDTRIGIWHIEESTNELKWALQWGKEDILSFNALKTDTRCLHWLSSRVLLRKMLNTTKFIDLQTDENGKPFLKDSRTNLSISHSGELVAVLVSSHPVGVDLQKRRLNIEEVAHKFISPEEMLFVNKCSDRSSIVHVIWCAKEALYKLYGKKKLDFKENLKVLAFEYQPEGGFISGRIEKNSYARDFEIRFELRKEDGEDYFLAYVIDETIQ